MSILDTDIILRLSGGSGNSAQASSLGGVMSSATAMSSAIFPRVTGVEEASGITKYRCFYVLNNHGSLTLVDARAFFSDVSTDEDADVVISMGLGTAGENGTEQTIANENTAPSGVTFSTPTTYAGGLSLGDLEAGSRYPIWLRLVVASGAGVNSSIDFTVDIKGDTL